MAPDFAWAFCQIILRFEKRCWQYIDNFFYLFICLFVCPPKLSTCATCALRSNLVAWRSLRKHGTPMRTFQAYQPTNLHLFKRSKRFEVLTQKQRGLKLGYYAPPPAHPEGSAAAARNEAHWSAHVTYIVLYIYNMLYICYICSIYLLNLLWCIHRHDILIVLHIQPSVWCLFHYCNRWWVRWMPGGHRDSARTEGQKRARTQSSCFMTGHAPPPGGFR